MANAQQPAAPPVRWDTDPPRLAASIRVALEPQLDGGMGIVQLIMTEPEARLILCLLERTDVLRSPVAGGAQSTDQPHPADDPAGVGSDPGGTGQPPLTERLRRGVTYSPHRTIDAILDAQRVMREAADHIERLEARLGVENSAENTERRTATLTGRLMDGTVWHHEYPVGGQHECAFDSCPARKP